MNKKTIEALIEKYLNGVCTPEETEWVEQWLDERSKQNSWTWENEDHKEEIKNEIFEKLDSEVSLSRATKHIWGIPVRMVKIAAVLLVCLSFGVLTLLENKTDIDLPHAAKVVDPGTKAAVLQMGNGEIIYLDDKEDGILSQSEDIEISKRAGGKIEYTARNHKEKTVSGKIMENNLFIPRGGQYQLVLPDGTKVWLNSETTLTYPTHFVGMERKVKLVGEAYFEVARNVDKPFIIHSDGMDIKVLGTQFNVSSYKNASEVSTTLVEGAVEIIQEKGNIKLLSGQQAYKKVGKEGFEKRNVNVDNIVSWKEGYFSFDYQTLEEVMANISRWYNIEYDIVGKSKKPERLGGTFSRSKNLDELLTYLEKLVDVKITKTERRVTLMY